MVEMLILKILIIGSCVLSTLSGHDEYTKCLTGYMTDVQKWVDHAGVLQLDTLGERRNALDLSASTNPMPLLYQNVMLFKSSNIYLKYLSLARCRLTGVPSIFTLQDSQGRNLSDTVVYLTFYGNEFLSYSSAGVQYDSQFNATGAVESSKTYRPFEQQAVWTSGFAFTQFTKLKELDLRFCKIEVIDTSVFNGMNKLEALYLSENNIYFIEANAFDGLTSLKHLDLSRNQAYDDQGKLRYLASNTYYVFQNLTNLESLDLSNTRLSIRNHGMFAKLNKNLKKLSLCQTGLTSLPDNVFNDTSLHILDLSNNNGILTSPKSLSGLEKSLTVLYSANTGLQDMKVFKNYEKLEILKLVNNEISALDPDVAKTLKNLKILDLHRNRLTSWFEPTFSLMPNLKFLSLQENSISFLNEEIIEDLQYVDYVALSGNFIICNCYVKDFFKMAYKNDRTMNDTLIKPNKVQDYYHKGFDDYNAIINNRNKVNFECEGKCYSSLNVTGKFRLVDFRYGLYKCIYLPESVSMEFYEVDSCGKSVRDLDYDKELTKGRKRLIVLITIPCLMLSLVFLFIFRRNLRYCFITMRNSAMLSLINKDEVIDDGTIFNYDVFVSYCNEDRGWVLDYLLPQIERDCSISACLHERDFQVGLSILENIVSCMDRSRSIMLIISQRFLLSQWCQFEMHLAQHRLLETRREDLILVLLEDIPRRLRPNTLHYLMVTKTYIVWPKEESERNNFWRRLKKSLMSQKNKIGEGVSIA